MLHAEAARTTAWVWSGAVVVAAAVGLERREGRAASDRRTSERAGHRSRHGRGRGGRFDVVCACYVGFSLSARIRGGTGPKRESFWDHFVWWSGRSERSQVGLQHV